jgi:hypothetical protein
MQQCSHRAPRKPITVATRFKACTALGRSNTGTVGSNSSKGMDVCPRPSVLCCPA